MRQLVDFMGLRRHQSERPRVPENTALFIIGDIHGRADLLVTMHGLIRQHAEKLPEQTKKIIVYLGDYIDRGPDSALVIDTFVSGSMTGFKSFYLLGNHELALISYLKGETDFMAWMRDRDDHPDMPTWYLQTTQLIEWLHENGGKKTLKSYGVNVTSDTSSEALAEMRIELLRKIPTDHLVFLETLQLNYSLGDFFCAHAGIDPQIPLSEQKPSDLLMIREPFLSSTVIYDRVVVHGHTPDTNPVIRPNRLGLDTEAFASNVLSGVMIVDDKITLLQTN